MPTIRTSMTSKCCCDCDDVYQLDECPTSTGCPTDGVFVSCAALEWLHEQSPNSVYVICYSNHCCLWFDYLATIKNVFLAADVIADGGVIIYSKTEDQIGIPIQDYPECVCNDCIVESGACCYVVEGSDVCTLETQADCEAITGGKYFGDGTCCQGDAGCEPEDEVECTDPDPPDCELYAGLCINKNDKVTRCGSNGNASGCSSTYAFDFLFPTLTLYTGTSGAGAFALCPPNTCPDNDGGTCCTSDLSGSNAFATITKTAQDQETWSSGTSWVVGGDLDGNWHASASCLNSMCENQTCNFCDHPVYQPCFDAISEWDCPCCSATKFEKFRFTVIITETSVPPSNSHGIDECSPPCNLWTIDLTLSIGTNGCLGDFSCGDCPSDCANNPDDICYTSGTSMRWKVRKPDCGCPAGLSSSDAHFSTTLDADSQEERCFHACGCERWVFFAAGAGTYKVKALDLLQGITWSVT